MPKPIDSVRLFVDQARQYCPYLRRVQAASWRCGILGRATGADACLPDDWTGCPLNDGGKPAKSLTEVLT